MSVNFTTLAPNEDCNNFDGGRNTALNPHKYVTAAFRQWNLAHLTNIRVAVSSFQRDLIST